MRGGPKLVGDSIGQFDKVNGAVPSRSPDFWPQALDLRIGELGASPDESRFTPPSLEPPALPGIFARHALERAAALAHTLGGDGKTWGQIRPPPPAACNRALDEPGDPSREIRGRIIAQHAHYTPLET